MQSCGVCLSLALEPRKASGSIGVWTSSTPLIERASDDLGVAPDGERHIVVAVCPEHVAEIYRGRIPGMTMAWKLSPNQGMALPLAPVRG